jgi:aldehyde dehydrogenase (NAD+)
MAEKSLNAIRERQRKHFDSGATLPLSFRKNALKKLLAAIEANQDAIEEALFLDLGKSSFEALATEIGYVRKEIKSFISNLNSWTAAQKVNSPILITGPASAKVIYQPKGCILIISPWNYPFQLVMAPLAGAIAAGNTVVVKPSEFSSNTEKIIKKVIAESFDEALVSVVTGGVKETQELLSHQWDHIFFTGSTKVGKIVMKAAAEHLSPVTLELGGKSPTVIAHDANIKLAAKRIAWGKFINAGQTCIAPDYILIPETLLSTFRDELNKNILHFFGSDPSKSEFYGQIISQSHFDRLAEMLPKKDDAIREKRFIPPSFIELKMDEKHPSMEQEIFGPILPIITYSRDDEAINFIRNRPRPLALYVFTKSASRKKRYERETHSGGLVFNDVIMHIANANLPFGGIGESGMGSYHGKYSIECFSHKKPVHRASTLIDIPLRYPPYPAWAKKLLDWLF